ncbi:hypothetical protein EPUS_07450 [Endocarpon pusillum Z07020]|uniref:Uncharacterized protein n=1 Tax=Endocarpon pusillum (strain Z07020 / HMAS-L-300199) TaxID=1263415 RepID=U1HNN1_ENDPU|nr:uncharacterized protein EPUS_07450 [Endocarpon pusillum Z07020]ERF71980.1 hypothetical protein EPUS_07450 [Endocarpon pusillum Z07020]
MALYPNCKNQARQQKDPYGSLNDASEKTVGTSVVGGGGGGGGGEGTGGNYLHYQQHVEGEESAAGAGAAVERYHYSPENSRRLGHPLQSPRFSGHGIPKSWFRPAMEGEGRA